MNARVFAIALGAVVLAACGNQTARPGASTSPSTRATATASASEPLFAVLETRRSGVPSWNQSSPDTIAIAGVDGRARAKATFTPRSLPIVPMAATVLPVQARVAAGAVYFIDGKGVVRRLEPSGSVQAVTTFPITSSQQDVSFAVSPDGNRLMAAVFTHASVVPGPSSGPAYIPTGPARLDLEVANAGGSATTVKHWQGSASSQPGPQFHNITMAGWDAVGPIVLADGYEAVQNTMIEGEQWAGGHLARIGLSGDLGSPIGPAGCQPYSVEQEGDILCLKGTSLNVVSGAGQVLWQVSNVTAPLSISGGFALSPEGSQVAMDGLLAGKGGSRTTLAANFSTRGWIDDQTIIGFVGFGTSRIGIIRASSPTKVEDWGFSGQYVGRLGST